MATKLEILRKIINEEVTKVIQKEMLLLRNEITKSGRSAVIENKAQPTSYAKSVVANIPGTLNTKPYSPAATKFVGNDPMTKLLNETAMTMGNDDAYAYSVTDDMADPTNFFQPTEVAVGDVDGMLSSARASSNIEMIQINQVPDFNNLMKNMMAKGVI
jgi:hypothetical protein